MMHTLWPTLRTLRICSNIDKARLRCLELVDHWDNRGHDKRKTSIQIKRAFTSYVSPSVVYQSHTTRPVYLNVQLHHGSTDLKGISHRYMPLLHQSVTVMTVVLDLPIGFSQPYNLCHSLRRANVRQAHCMINETPRPSQCC